MSFRTMARDLLSRYPALDGAFRRIIWSHVHFPEIELRYLDALEPNSIDIAVDVGAALGPYSWILNRKSRRVFAFEPGEVHGRYLEASVSGTRVTLVRAAVGESTGTVKMYTAGSDVHANHSATISASNPVATQSGAVVREVPQVTLDGYFADHLKPGDRIDFLKVDVEGYEGAVFRGAAQIIQAHKPLIICEIESRHDPKYADTFNFLRGHGYQTFVYQDGRYRPFDGDAIEPLQTESALADRLSRSHDPAANTYINNFVFQHSHSRLKVA